MKLQSEKFSDVFFFFFIVTMTWQLTWQFLVLAFGILDVSRKHFHFLSTASSACLCFDILQIKIRQSLLNVTKQFNTQTEKRVAKNSFDCNYPTVIFQRFRFRSVPTRRFHAAPLAEGPVGKKYYFLMNLRDASRSCSRHAGHRPVTVWRLFE